MGEKQSDAILEGAKDVQGEWLEVKVLKSNDFLTVQINFEDAVKSTTELGRNYCERRLRPELKIQMSKPNTFRDIDSKAS